MRTLVDTASRASWMFVCDKLNWHKYESLVRFVAQHRSLTEELSRKGKSGILKNLESRAEFLHWEDHWIRIVYTPNHCPWPNQIGIWFGIISHRLLKRKSNKSIEELEANILWFIIQCNLMGKSLKWTYKGLFP